MGTKYVEETTKKAEELALKLAEAIERGDKELALECAGWLAEQRAPVTVQVKPEAYPKKEISLWVGVEDAQMTTVPIYLQVNPHMTLASLKDMVFLHYGFPPSVQQWVVGKRLPGDQETLHYNGIQRDGDMAYLYLRSAKEAKLSEETFQRERQRRVLAELGFGDISLQPRGSQEPADAGLGAGAQEQDSLCMEELRHELSQVEAALPPEPPTVGWVCPSCTYVNKPTRPGCEICCKERPEDYAVPTAYQPDEEELARMRNEEEAMRQSQQVTEQQKIENYQHILQVDRQSLVPAAEVIECPICFVTLQPGKGVTLRECLHSFCRWVGPNPGPSPAQPACAREPWPFSRPAGRPLPRFLSCLASALGAPDPLLPSWPAPGSPGPFPAQLSGLFPSPSPAQLAGLCPGSCPVWLMPWKPRTACTREPQPLSRSANWPLPWFLSCLASALGAPAPLLPNRPAPGSPGPSPIWPPPREPWPLSCLAGLCPRAQASTLGALPASDPPRLCQLLCVSGLERLVAHPWLEELPSWAALRRTERSPGSLANREGVGRVPHMAKDR
ncbi:ranBP-type and C3HC4-type zinc finger-containing protein 1 isoform X1 [Terrapene carolina triunguis]|uniref:ranBP-type and C3HC4-type zinc finger-containing protein 1 isoform X1 n=1 Tax=Terrapene triunguis TaxID=2587831 RepID=UPI000E778AE8|nr:ranBP-type and C3HC4-type zinc finger-containing protein 1 isoform X1 [Terrapene carolina triunguis]